MNLQRQHLLDWELKWIDDNPERYEGPYHQLAVKNNIIRRYWLDELKQNTDRWAAKATGSNVESLKLFLGYPYP